MKITFLEIDTDSYWALASVGPGYIAAYVRSQGHAADMVRVAADDNINDVVERIEAVEPDIIGVSLTAMQWQRAVQVVRGIRKQLRLPIIAGGVQATFAPEKVLSTNAFDYVCLGEGEAATCDVLDCMQQGIKISAGRIDNIWVKGGGRPDVRPVYENLDQLPFVARDFLCESYGVIHISTQRGCPFQCPFCVGGAISGIYDGKQYYRQRSIENVLKEIDLIRATGPLNYIIFLDGTCTANRQWIEEFCSCFRRDVGVGFSMTTRVETIDPELIAKLAGAGLKHVAYGVESGSARIRRHVLNRPLDNQRFIDVFNWTRQEGVMATANYMIGLPGETADDIEQTLALRNMLASNDGACFVFYPFAGTKLFELCRAKGFLPADYWDLPANTQKSVLMLPDLSQELIERYYEKFEVPKV